MPGSVTQIDFAEALDRTNHLERDILLGNGFSIAAHPAFNYKRLLDQASIPTDTRAIFDRLRTADFEAVMRQLLVDSQCGDQQRAVRAREEIETLKTALVRAVHQVHPARRWAIPDDRWTRCETFLEHFIGRRRPGGRVFTTNYDLLLCWATAPDRDQDSTKKKFHGHDGFKGGVYEGQGRARIIYLHGALHLFPGQGTTTRLSYLGTGVALHDQISERLKRNQFPAFVAEGASRLKRPQGAGFLRDGLKSFKGTNLVPAKKALFTLGHGLGLQDEHILESIPQGKLPAVYLGGFGQDELDCFVPIARHWIEQRAELGGPELNIFLFDSTGLVWGA